MTQHFNNPVLIAIRFCLLATTTMVLSSWGQADPAFVPRKAFDLPPQAENLVLDAAGIIKLGEILATSYFEHR